MNACGRGVRVPGAETARILSLIPEATEILEALGLGDQVVRAPHAGAIRAGTAAAEEWPDLAPDALAAARPSLIFTSATGAGGGVPRQTVRRAAARLHPRPAVYALEPHSLGDILSDIKTVGDATGQQAAARHLIVALRTRIDAVTLQSARLLASGVAPRVACLAGMSASGEPVAAGWWLAELVGLAGGLDVFHGTGRPPRPVSWAALEAARPDMILVPDMAVLARLAEVVVAPASGAAAPARRPRLLSFGPDVAQEGGSVSARVSAPSWPGSGAVRLLERFARWCGPDHAEAGAD